MVIILSSGIITLSDIKESQNVRGGLWESDGGMSGNL